MIIRSASPSKEIPRLTFFLFEKDLILFGKVDPQLELIFNPFGEVPILKTFAPSDSNIFGPAL